MTVLDRIKLDEPDTKSRYTEMLKEWLKLIHPMPSWEGLMGALKQPLVNCSDLALRIAEKHLSGTVSTKSLSCSPVHIFLTLSECAEGYSIKMFVCLSVCLSLPGSWRRRHYDTRNKHQCRANYVHSFRKSNCHCHATLTGFALF